MKHINEKLIYIILIYMNFTFILRLLEKGMYIQGFDYKFTSLLLLIGFSIYGFYVYVLKRRIYRIMFTLIMLALATAYCSKNIELVRGMLNNYIIHNAIVLNDLIYNGEITYFYQYKIILVVIIPVTTALILWITFKFIKEFILMISFAAITALWFSNSYTVVKDYLFSYILVSLLTFIIMNYIKTIKEYRDKGIKVSLKFSYILLYGIILSIILTEVTFMLPQEYKGHNSTSIGDYFQNKFASGISSMSKTKYGLSISGYSNNEKKLGGPISINYQEVFKVKSDKPYYLKGNVKDFYNGSKWRKSYEDYFKANSSGYIGKPNYGGSANRVESSMTLYPSKTFKINTIFVPNYAFSVTGVKDTLSYDEIPTVFSEKTVSEAYSINFYKYEDNIDTIEDVRDYSKNFLEKKDTASGLYYLPMDYLLQPKLKNDREVINRSSSHEAVISYKSIENEIIESKYVQYLQVPENISDRTYHLVEDIIKDCETSVEKVLEIKNYLTKNYVYELEVSEVPAEAEFLDYFLFEEKKGYCTYFNTAMTVMCRIAGVPARYVEGFKIPSEKNSDGLYVVTNAEAHAWCEVPLGAFQYADAWTIADASPTASEDLQRKLEEFRRKQQDVGNGDTDMDTDIIDESENTAQDDKVAQGDNEAQDKDLNKGTLLSDKHINQIKIVITVILFILLRIMKVSKRRKKLLKSTEVVPLYNYYLYRLSAVGIIKPEYKGDLEFSEGIEDYKVKKRMKTLVQGAYEEFYGKHSMVVLDNKDYYDFLEEYLKKRQGSIKYLLNKYLGTV